MDVYEVKSEKHFIIHCPLKGCEKLTGIGSTRSALASGTYYRDMLLHAQAVGFFFV